MAQPPLAQTKPRTKLARWRLKRKLTQADMVRWTGVPLSTYQRLEHGNYQRPQVQALANCAIVLDCSLEDLLEERFLRWTVFHPDAASPPKTPVWQTRE
jgi:transcriptional regulator with XRE-family HTH domain